MLSYGMATPPARRAATRRSADQRRSVETACPLDCPDACSLAVTVQHGKVVTIDGSHKNPVTDGYICAKVRRFGERVYGPDRLLHPGRPQGPQGRRPIQARDVGRGARAASSSAMQRAKAESGGESILPVLVRRLERPADAGQPRRARCGGASARRGWRARVCAAPTGAANMALYGKMPSVTYQDYPEAQLIVLWGVNPSASGIHLVPYVREAQKRGAKLVVVDPRTTPLARAADLHLAGQAGHRRRRRAGDSPVSVRRTATPTRRSCASTRAAPSGCASAPSEWTIERAADVAGHRRRARSSGSRELYADELAGAGPLRLGPRAQSQRRQRRDGGAGAAGRRRQVRRARRRLLDEQLGVVGHRPALDRRATSRDTRLVNMNQLGRALTEYDDPPVNVLFVYNCNPAATVPDQQRVLRGLEREDLFTVVFEQVMTDTALYADVVLPATTFLEGYDFAKAYGPINLELGAPGRSTRSARRGRTPTCSASCARGSACSKDDEPTGELDLLRQRARRAARHDRRRPARRARARRRRSATRRCSSSTCSRTRRTGRSTSSRTRSTRARRSGLYRFQPDPATERYPLALISPASERTISSTLGELPRPDVKLTMHPDDARGARAGRRRPGARLQRARRGALPAAASRPSIRPGTVSLPKGLWRRSTRNGVDRHRARARHADRLGGGACFNDARVQVASLATA